MFIRHLTLYTDKVNQLADFYSATLGLPLAGRGAETFTLSCGQSTLTFRQHAAVPPYHFAFNIPPRQEEAALAWLKERVAVLHGDDGEITDFPAWNARAVYFTDPAGNIVEFIARRDLPYPPAKALWAAGCDGDFRNRPVHRLNQNRLRHPAPSNRGAGL